MDLAQEIKKIESNSDEDSYLETEVRHILRKIENRPVGAAEKIQDARNQLSTENPILDALDAKIIWDYGKDYQNGAKPALSYWEQSQEFSKKNELDRLVILCIKQRINIKRQLNQDIDPVIADAIEELEKYEPKEDIHLGNFGELVRLLCSNKDYIEDQKLIRVAEICETRSDILEDQKKFLQQRDFLEHAIELRRYVGNTAKHQEEIIGSVETQVEELDRDLAAGGILRDAIQDYQEFLPGDKREEWLELMRHRNKAGQKEMVPPQLDENMRKKLEESREKTVQNVIERFKQISEEVNSEYALFCFLNSDFGIPVFKMPEAQSMMQQLLGTRHQDSSGNIVANTPSSTEEESPETIRPSYSMEANQERSLIFEVLNSLIDDSYLTIGDFFILLDSCDLEAQEDALLTDFVIRTFDEDNIGAAHLGFPVMEKITRSIMKRKGIFPGSFNEGTSRDRTLGGLLEVLEDENRLEKNYSKMLRFVYTESRGFDLRNELCHGKIEYNMLEESLSQLLLFDIARIMVRVDKEKYWSKYGYPINF